MPRRPVLGSVPSNGATVSAAVKLMGLASTAGVSVSQSASGAGSASDAPWWLSELASGEAGEGEGAGDGTAVADEQAAAPRSGKRKVRPDIADAAPAPGRKRPRRNAQPTCRENVAAAVSAFGLARVNASPDNNNCLAYSLLLALGWACECAGLQVFAPGWACECEVVVCPNHPGACQCRAAGCPGASTTVFTASHKTRRFSGCGSPTTTFRLCCRQRTPRR